MFFPLLLTLLACGPDMNDPIVASDMPKLALPESPSDLAYTVDLRQAAQHLFQVTATIQGQGAETPLFMATWTPGSYLIREYSRHIEGIRATTLDGQPLEVRKIDKNQWVVEGAGDALFALSYTVYARELTVRTNFVDADLAMINGAPTFIVPPNRLDQPLTIHMQLPQDWERVETALPAHPTEANHFVAADYDMLVDSPVIAGNPVVNEFEVSGVPHKVVHFGESEGWDYERAAADTKAIVETQTKFWGVIPYENYVFLNGVVNSRGGLEHKASSLMLAGRALTRDSDKYEGWLGLISHEFFHTWNVKRLRPEALGPFNYTEEVRTPDLWVAEGITSYYDDLMLVRAGLMTEKAYLKRLSSNLSYTLTTPGVNVQSLSAASSDAWIKFYRRDENTVNTGVSYYTKGAAVAFLLDQRIQEATQGNRSLDDVMRLAYQRYSAERGYTPQEFRDTCSEVAGVDLTDFFQRYVDDASPINFDHALDYFGLGWKSPSKDTKTDKPEPGWLGVTVRGGKVREVRRDTPAWQAGLNVDDELLAIAGRRVGGDGSNVIHFHAPGETVELLIARRGLIRTLTATLGEKPREWAVEAQKGAKLIESRRRAQWLNQ